MYFLDEKDFLMGINNYEVQGAYYLNRNCYDLNKTLFLENTYKVRIKKRNKRVLNNAINNGLLFNRNTDEIENGIYYINITNFNKLIEKNILLEDTDKVMVYDRNKHDYNEITISTYKNSLIESEGNEYNKFKVYDTIQNKSIVLSLKDIYNLIETGNIFGYDNNRDIINSSIEQLFVSGNYMYYVYNNIVLVCRDKLVQLYEIVEQKSKRGYCNVAFSRGRVKLYTCIHIPVQNYRTIIIKSTSKVNLKKEIPLSEDNFSEVCKPIAVKYIMSR